MDAFASSLPPARVLASIVDDAPAVSHLPADGTTTDVVVLGDAAEIDELETTTATIARVERGTRRRWRRRLGVVLLVAALAATAWGAWTYLIPHRADVPVLSGGTVEAARERLSDLGFVVRIADGQHSDRVPDGGVLRVQPEAGTSLELGETVTIVPSLGPPPVKAPKLVGLTFEKAATSLERLGLEPSVARRRFHDEIPEGRVIEQLQSGMVPAGSTVELILSKGHAPVPVPKVAGATESRATETLQAAGFSVTTETTFSNRVERGSVLGVSPKAGTVAPYASRVTLTISLGPERFPLPSFIGLSKSAAEAKASSYGLDVSFFVVPNTTGSLVISQTPAPNVTVSYGDGVTLFIA